MDKIIALWNALVRFVRPDVDAIIAGFLKAQAKLGSFIEREEAVLAAEAARIEALVQSRIQRNTTLNRAYRIIHNLDQLVA